MIIYKSDDEQRIVCSVIYASTPSDADPRLDSQEEYISSPVLEEAIQKMMIEKGDQPIFNIEHDDGKGLFNFPILELGLAEEPMKKYGYQLQPGDFFMTLKITDDDTWAKIKDGTINGFSIEGVGEAA